MEFQQDYTFKHYDYREEVLNYICALVPNNIKGEISENLYKVLLKDLWGKIYRKKSAAKISYSVKLHSAISNNAKNTPHHKCFPE